MSTPYTYLTRAATRVQPSTVVVEEVPQASHIWLKLAYIKLSGFDSARATGMESLDAISAISLFGTTCML